MLNGRGSAGRVVRENRHAGKPCRGNVHSESWAVTPSGPRAAAGSPQQAPAARSNSAHAWFMLCWTYPQQ